MSPPTALLEMRGITKEFSGVRALSEVDFDLGTAEVVGLVGENGAGKSTLMKILSGVYPHGSFGGEIRIEGRPQRFASTADARAAGIAIVHQELSLVPEMTVAENLLLGREPNRLGVIDTVALVRQGQRMLEAFGASTIDPEVPVRQLGVGLQQIVEIARALGVPEGADGARGTGARVVVLDEPTAALTDRERDHLFEVLIRLKATGTTFVYISHRMEELFTVCDRFAVLRDGRSVGAAVAARTTPDEVVAMVVGQELAQMRIEHPAGWGAPRQVDCSSPAPRTRPAGEVMLEVEHLTVDHPQLAHRKVVDDVSLSVRAGEVVALAGAMGAGRTALLSALFGAALGKTAGQVRVAGAPVTIDRPAAAIASGIALVPEDRKGQGLVLGMTVAENITLASLSGWIVDEIKADQAADASTRELRIKVPGLGAEVTTLSGGNQQKVVLGKWLQTAPKVLLLDEPTRGVDVGAKAEIYRLIGKLVENGLAILMASSDLPEVLLLSDWVLVLREGRLAGALSRAEASQQAIMQLAIGVAS